MNWTFALLIRGGRIANVQSIPLAGTADIAIKTGAVSISLALHSGYAKAAANLHFESI